MSCGTPATLSGACVYVCVCASHHHTQDCCYCITAYVQSSTSSMSPNAFLMGERLPVTPNGCLKRQLGCVLSDRALAPPTKHTRHHTTPCAVCTGALPRGHCAWFSLVSKMLQHHRTTHTELGHYGVHCNCNMTDVHMSSSLKLCVAHCFQHAAPTSLWIEVALSHVVGSACTLHVGYNSACVCAHASLPAPPLCLPNTSALPLTGFSAVSCVVGALITAVGLLQVRR